MTNGDKIRQMTDEQLAEHLNCKACELFEEPQCDSENCEKMKMKWLRQDVIKDAEPD